MVIEHDISQELPSKKSATNWDEVDSLTDDDIHQAAADDPDNPILSDTQLKQMRPVAEILPNLLKQTKVITTLPLSPEVVVYFKAQGKNWQTQIDEILKQYVAQH